jgi:hypothetical protein
MANALPRGTDLLVAERNAVVQPLELLLRVRGVAFEDLPARIAHICLLVGAESWVRAHPELPSEDAARLFGEMAEAAVQAMHDGGILVAARRNCKEGNHA